MDTDEYLKEVGNRISERRKELNMSQGDLAKKLGYNSPQAVSLIELGKRNIKQSQLELFAKALDVPPGWIMGWSDSHGIITYGLEDRVIDEIKKADLDHLVKYLKVLSDEIEKRTEENKEKWLQAKKFWMDLEQK